MSCSKLWIPIYLILSLPGTILTNTSLKTSISKITKGNQNGFHRAAKNQNVIDLNTNDGTQTILLFDEELKNFLRKKQNICWIVAQDNKGNTPLHYAIDYGNTVLAKILITVIHNNKEVSLDYQNKQGQTALHIAVERQNYELVELLLSCKASLKIEDNGYWSPLDFAITCYDKNSNMLSLFAKHIHPFKRTHFLLRERKNIPHVPPVRRKNQKQYRTHKKKKLTESQRPHSIQPFLTKIPIHPQTSSSDRNSSLATATDKVLTSLIEKHLSDTNSSDNTLSACIPKKLDTKTANADQPTPNSDDDDHLGTPTNDIYVNDVITNTPEKKNDEITTPFPWEIEDVDSLHRFISHCRKMPLTDLMQLCKKAAEILAPTESKMCIPHTYPCRIE